MELERDARGLGTDCELRALEARRAEQALRAVRNRDRFPVDLNRAEKPDLLRIPGVGVRSVERILTVRRWRRLRMEDLTRLRISLGRALPFIVVDDHSPRALTDVADLRHRITDRSQLDLFSMARSARTGEL